METKTLKIGNFMKKTAMFLVKVYLIAIFSMAFFQNGLARANESAKVSSIEARM
jgi:preprotein translocase subunit SecG